MEWDLAALASLAASTLVGEMASAGWEETQQAMGGLWRRVHPERADAVVADLGEARAEVLEARRNGDESAERDFVDEWQVRLRRLLAADPQVMPELQQLIDELRPTARITQTAHASGHARITLAGRDINITKG